MFIVLLIVMLFVPLPMSAASELMAAKPSGREDVRWVAKVVILTYSFLAIAAITANAVHAGWI